MKLMKKKTMVGSALGALGGALGKVGGGLAAFATSLAGGGVRGLNINDEMADIMP